ncbi:MAG: hypothetical protein NVSMB6_16190 [Burkholderiaceae bacterium]
MKSIDSYSDPGQLRILMGNARNHGADMVYWEAFERLCEVSATGEDQLTRDFNRIMAAYEQLLTEKNQRTTRATRTRQKVKRHGIIRVLQDWADSETRAYGFTMLAERGLLTLTGEYLVIEYADKFPAVTVENAKRHLREATQSTQA